MPDTKGPQHRYPVELRERAVRMVFETIEHEEGAVRCPVARVAHQLGIGTESLRGWVRQAEIDGAGGATARPGKRRHGPVTLAPLDDTAEHAARAQATELARARR